MRKEDGEDKGRMSTLESEVEADVAKRQSRKIRGFVVLEALGRWSLFSATPVPLISTMMHTHDGECATGLCY